MVPNCSFALAFIWLTLPSFRTIWNLDDSPFTPNMFRIGPIEPSINGPALDTYCILSWGVMHESRPAVSTEVAMEVATRICLSCKALDVGRRLVSARMQA
jgi:hypothetical protein